jgi:hypothetical protein
VCALILSNLKKLAEADFTASLRAGQPPIVLIDEAVVPGDYWRLQPAKLDKQQLYSALRGGRDIPGAVLGNGEQTIAVSYARKLVMVISGGVFCKLDPVLERHSFDEFGELV